MRAEMVEFRGRTATGEWVYGDLIKNRFPKDTFNGWWHIEYQKDGCRHLAVVDPETVGEYTGRKDIKGKKIYEHDVIKDRFGMTFAVLFDDEENRFIGVGFCDALWGERQGDVRYIRQCSIDEFELQVVDTVFDNADYQETKKICEEDEEELK